MEEIVVRLGNGQDVCVRLSSINGRWLASADTPGGPSLGIGWDRLAAIYVAVDPFQPEIDDALEDLMLALERHWQEPFHVSEHHI